MRLLTFTPRSKQFAMLYAALLSDKAPLSVADLGTHVAVLGGFRELGPSGEGELKNEKGGHVEVETEGWELLKKRLDLVIPFLPPMWSPEIAETRNWLAGLPSLSASDVVAARVASVSDIGSLGPSA